jgi:hypothetical protein
MQPRGKSINVMMYNLGFSLVGYCEYKTTCDSSMYKATKDNDCCGIVKFALWNKSVSMLKLEFLLMVHPPRPPTHSRDDGTSIELIESIKTMQNSVASIKNIFFWD